MSLVLADKYGITHDEPGIYNAGELYLEYLLTGDKKFLQSDQNSQKKLSLLNLKQHPWHKESAYGTNNHPQIIPVLSAITCKVFFQKLNWLNSVDAHHLPLFLISSVGIAILAYFIYSETANLFLALTSALFLGLFPRFFAMSHNNPVDAVSAIAIMIAAASFYKGFRGQNLPYILLASFLLGVNFAIKANAVITVAATLSWLFVERKGRLWKCSWKKNDIFLLLAYFSIAFIVFMVCHAHYWDIKFNYIYEVFNRTLDLIKYEKATGIGTNPNWNFTQPFVLFAVTPPVMIISFPLGAFFLYKNHRSLFFLFFFLFFWSLFRTCLPYAKNFDGIRHYIEIAVPLGVFSAAGLLSIANWFCKKFPKELTSYMIYPLLFGLAFICMIFSVYKYFPYEIVYFNSFVGGAKQAPLNNRLRYYAGDYWQTSSLEIVNWLNENGEKNAQIYDLIGISHYYSNFGNPESILRGDFIYPENYIYQGKSFSKSICNKSPWRDVLNPLQKTKPDFLKNPACFLGNGYMIITSLTQSWLWKSLYVTLIYNGKIVKTIAREGYPIVTIVKTNALIIYDNKSIVEALHFDLDSNIHYILSP